MKRPLAFTLFAALFAQTSLAGEVPCRSTAVGAAFKALIAEREETLTPLGAGFTLAEHGVEVENSRGQNVDLIVMLGITENGMGQAVQASVKLQRSPDSGCALRAPVTFSGD